MYRLTEVYKVLAEGGKGKGVPETRTRLVLVNPTLITFVRDYGEFRRVCFGGKDDYVEVEESMEHIRAWVK